MRKTSGYTLGIDSSTQSITAVVLDRNTFQTIFEHRVRYSDDPRLLHYGLTSGMPILSPLETGEASQPTALFLDALEALFLDIPREIIQCVEAINISAQQHGQVWLSAQGCDALQKLSTPDSMSGPTLSERLSQGFSYDRAPIWMSSNAQSVADTIRSLTGGQERIVALSGSDSPARFTGPVIARTAQLFPQKYKDTARIHLISSFLAGVLAGNSEAPIDWGNGSGTGMMNWKECKWDKDLLEATAKAGNLQGGADALYSKLPSLTHPLSQIGQIAEYFIQRYGFDEKCVIIASSGDNPQSKVLASGPLLSLGTSFVIMSAGETPISTANAMYDGLGCPFLFGCRTNGALAWESVRKKYGFAEDFVRAEKALKSVSPGSVLRILQTLPESFPPSPPIDTGDTGDFDTNYAGAVDAALGLMALASASFMEGPEPISATGGATSSREILARAAAIWNKPIVPILNAGAATGAAVAAACALVPESERKELVETGRAIATKPGATIEPETSAVYAYHRRGGYLDRLAEKFSEFTDKSTRI